MTKELLQVRKRIKAKKPTFVKQDTHKKKRIRPRWGKPRGWQSKIRLHKRGHRRSVTPGYGSPTQVKGLHPSGLEPIEVNTQGDLKQLDPEKQGIVISRSVGMRKKIILAEKAKEAGLKILNLKDPDSLVKKFQERIAKKKEAQTKKDKKKQAEKKTKESKKSEQLSEEEKKKQEKLEKDKLLTKKEN